MNRVSEICLGLLLFFFLAGLLYVISEKVRRYRQGVIGDPWPEESNWEEGTWCGVEARRNRTTGFVEKMVQGEEGQPVFIWSPVPQNHWHLFKSKGGPL